MTLIPKTPRAAFALLFAGAVGLVGVGLVIGEWMRLNPCPLCIVQRVFVILFALVCLIAAIHGPARGGRRGYAVLALLFAFLAGGVVMNTMKDELPLDGSGNAPAFGLGAVAYAALLLAV